MTTTTTQPSFKVGDRVTFHRGMFGAWEGRITRLRERRDHRPVAEVSFVRRNGSRGVRVVAVETLRHLEPKAPAQAAPAVELPSVIERKLGAEVSLTVELRRCRAVFYVVAEVSALAKAYRLAAQLAERIEQPEQILGSLRSWSLPEVRPTWQGYAVAIESSLEVSAREVNSLLEVPAAAGLVRS